MTQDRANRPNSFRTGPDDDGHFGRFGGRYVAETLMPLILDVEKAWAAARIDPSFLEEMDDLLRHYVGRPSPLYYAERLTEHLGGAKIYMKRDELNHTGAHKINHAIGRFCWPGAWGKHASSQKPGPGSMGWPPPPWRRALGCPAQCSWGQRISNGKSPMCFGCGFWGPRCAPAIPALPH